MFTFPRAHQKTQWQGQGSLLDGLIPYFGGDSLGVCFGISALWIKIDAPFDCISALRDKKEEIEAAQKWLTEEMEHDPLVALDSIANETIGPSSIPGRRYADGVASHIILDIHQANQAQHYIVAFYYTGGLQGTGGHAIAVSFDEVEMGKILDPNYGVASYQSRTSLCNDLHGLLASYVVPSGHITESYLLEFDNENVFGDFQGAS
ncbi:C58 family peptidase [Pseudomonas sp. MWU12-2037]|uniref:C58 family peptidase n=1 Tax=Pseudomonas sp. MWU12-2037 TaxID=2928690 RepID=UPI00200C30DF|nr:C58 family peptidase [Pseudomonas sp. MWU12-2037]